MTFNLSYPIQVIKTDRLKSASIEVDAKGVRVTVPKGLTDSRVEELVKKRSLWIKHKMEVQANYVPPKPKEFVTGECFTYLGRNYRLKLLNESIEGVKLKNGYLLVSKPKSANTVNSESQLRHQLEGWFQAHALARICEKVERYSVMLGVSPKSVKVRDYKTRWGSCTSSGVISFNWRIIIAPHQIVDYVVVHELCHMLEHNHSPKFWKHVKSVMPNYPEHRRWLKENSDKLNW